MWVGGAGRPRGLAKRVIACLDVRANDAGDLVVTKGDQYDVREAAADGAAEGSAGEVRPSRCMGANGLGGAMGSESGLLLARSHPTHPTAAPLSPRPPPSPPTGAGAQPGAAGGAGGALL